MLTVDETEFENLAEFENDVEMTCQKLLKLCSQNKRESLQRILGVINFETLDFSPRISSFLWVKIASFLPQTRTLGQIADTILTHARPQDINVSKMFPDETFSYESSKAAGCPVNGTLRLSSGHEFEGTHKDPNVAKAKCFSQFLLYLEEKLEGEFYVKLLSENKIGVRLLVPEGKSAVEDADEYSSDSPLFSIKTSSDTPVELVGGVANKSPPVQGGGKKEVYPRKPPTPMRYAPRQVPTHPYAPPHHHYQPQAYTGRYHPYGGHAPPNVLIYR